MYFKDLQDVLQNLTKKKILKKDIAQALVMDQGNFTKRCQNLSLLSPFDLDKISKAFSLPIQILENYNSTDKISDEFFTDNPECTCRHCVTCTKCILCGKNRDKVEIHYWEGCTDTWKHSKLTSLNFDREMVEDIWGREPENLRIVAMTGDKMDGGSYPFKNRDILLIDMSANSVEKTGAFLFTTRGGEGIYICNLDQKLNGDVVFSHNNPLFEETRYTKEQLRELDFKVIGRVFKNESYNL